MSWLFRASAWSSKDWASALAMVRERSGGGGGGCGSFGWRSARAGEAVGGAVVEARAADTAVELAEEADDARVRAAQRLSDEEDDGVALGERVGLAHVTG